jgi:Tfp pilus assembly protein PilF
MNQERIKQLTEMLTKEPNDCFLHHALGMEYLSSTNFEQAINCFRKVLSIDSNYLGTYYQLGQALEKSGNPNEAVKVYKIGIDLAKAKGDTKAAGELIQAFWMLEE